MLAEILSPATSCVAPKSRSGLLAPANVVGTGEQVSDFGHGHKAGDSLRGRPS